MIYPSNFESKIGFDLIRECVKKHCINAPGASLVDDMHFTSDLSAVQKLIDQTEEFRQIILSGSAFPLSDYADITPELKTLQLEGTVIDTDTLFGLKLSISVFSLCIDFLKKKNQDEIPELKKLSDEFTYDPKIVKIISQIIDDKGQVRDDASPELKHIRKELIQKQNNASKRIHAILQKTKKEGWVNSDAELTIRNGRLVIPMAATHKRKIRGFIHDESASGQTVFIEPDEIFEVNNEIKDLENAEKREIYRILSEFTIILRPEIPMILDSFRFLGIVDFIRAKALFALDIVASKPVLVSEPLIDWFNARHPLLFLSHNAQKKITVPMSVNLNNTDRILVISGPNAGGKSVCLKTIGLLQYMLQCGLLVSMDDQSRAGMFSDIFINIGDEQSIEDDLSTYSSHLLAMKFLISKAGAFTLFLIDEFGAGTEPRIGGAIAEAVLEQLNLMKAFGVVTTHYANLKLFAANTTGVMNGAMMFDTKQLQPLYKLLTGNPGSSFAFEIAEKTGLQKHVIEIAKRKADVKELDFEKQLQELELQKEALQKKEAELKMADEFLSEMIEKYKKLNEKLESQKKDIIKTAQNQAEELISKSNRIIEKTIKEIKETGADKEKTKLVRQELKSFSEKIQEQKPDEEKVGKKQVLITSKKIQPKKIKVLQGVIDKGDYVRIKGQTTIGEVLSSDKKEVLVLFGSSKIKTTIFNLEKVEGKPDIKNQKQRLYNANFSMKLDEKLAKFKTTIDLRGFKAEEALDAIAKYIDEALLLSIPEVRVLHGKGNGVLRNVIREFLRTVKEVKAVRDEILESGGHGITVVNFR